MIPKFSWDRKNIIAQLESCDRDGLTPIIFKFFTQSDKLLESGCGLGRYVKFLQDRGYRIIGLEYFYASIKLTGQIWPDLKIIQGDCTNSPFADNYFDGVLSFGVIEHQVDGPGAALADILRVLRPGGTAIISVPCFNSIRQIKKKIWWKEITQAPRALLACIIKRKKYPLNRIKPYKYAVFPTYGDFFEYRMTVEEFANEVKHTGFEIIDHHPLSEIDGVFHELNPFKLLVQWKNWKFRVSFIGRLLNEFLKKTPFRHSHMQIIVARKPLKL